MDIPELPKVKLNDYSTATGKPIISFELLTPFDITSIDWNKIYSMGLSDTEEKVEEFNQ